MKACAWIRNGAALLTRLSRERETKRKQSRDEPVCGLDGRGQERAENCWLLLLLVASLGITEGSHFEKAACLSSLGSYDLSRLRRSGVVQRATALLACPAASPQPASSWMEGCFRNAIRCSLYCLLPPATMNRERSVKLAVRNQGSGTARRLAGSRRARNRIHSLFGFKQGFPASPASCLHFLTLLTSQHRLRPSLCALSPHSLAFRQPSCC